MKITSSTIEYSSTHFLGTQETDAASLSVKGADMAQEKIHAEEQTDAAYEVQLSGLAAKESGGSDSNSIPPTGDAAADVETLSEAELAKLSPEDRYKVQLIQNYIGLLTGDKYKVLLGSGEQTSAPQNSSPTGALAQVTAATGHSSKIIDMIAGNASIDLSSLALDPARGIVGVISQQSQTSSIGDNTFVLGENDASGTQAWQEFKKTNTEPGIVTNVGDTTVFVPFFNQNGTASGLGIGASYTATQTNTEEEYTAWTEKGTITTADGRTIALDKTSLLYRTEETTATQATVTIDPLVIQYGDSSSHVELTDAKYNFDLNSDGQTDSISFVKPGAGFLALDQNQDGKINDGNELFGTKNGDGFGDLAKYDTDGNGWIDESDDIYNKLSIWSKDAQGNDQMLSLKQAGIGAIYLGSTSTEFTLKNEQSETQGQIRRSGFYLHEDGSAGTVQQIDLVSGTAASTAQQPEAAPAVPLSTVNSATETTTETAWQSTHKESQTQAVFAPGFAASITPEESGNVIVVRRDGTSRPPVTLMPSTTAKLTIENRPLSVSFMPTDKAAAAQSDLQAKSSIPDDTTIASPADTQTKLAKLDNKPLKTTDNLFFIQDGIINHKLLKTADLLQQIEQAMKNYQKQLAELAKTQKKAEETTHSSQQRELQEIKIRLLKEQLSPNRNSNKLYRHVNVIL